MLTFDSLSCLSILSVNKFTNFTLMPSSSQMLICVVETRPSATYEQGPYILRGLIRLHHGLFPHYQRHNDRKSELNTSKFSWMQQRSKISEQDSWLTVLNSYHPNSWVKDVSSARVLQEHLDGCWSFGERSALIPLGKALGQVLPWKIGICHGEGFGSILYFSSCLIKETIVLRSSSGQLVNLL